MITAGQYKGRAIKGKTQVGETDSNGTLEIAIDMALNNSAGEPVGTMTTFLFFTDKSASYSYERLRVLGWKGTGPADIDKLDDIYENEVPCTVEAPAPYKDPKDGSQKMGVSKLTIDTVGAGTVTLNKPLTMSEFKARLMAMGGSSGGGSAPANGGGKAPPF
jgi:hypothetical protein